MLVHTQKGKLHCIFIFVQVNLWGVGITCFKALFTFCDNFLDGHMKSSNNEDPSDEATTTAAGTRAPPTDSEARPGLAQAHVPTRIKKFLHFPRSYSDLNLLGIVRGKSIQ